MIQKTRRKHWSDQEKVHLSLGHKMGATLKTLSIVFDRSETCLNKALGRWGIRQYGASKPGQKSKKERLFMVTPQNVRDYIAAYEKEKSTSSHSETTFKKKQDPDGKTNMFPNPLINFPKRPPYKAQPFWSDLDFVINFLKKNGHQIQRDTNTSKIIGGVKIEFWLDGVPMSAAQLLMRANRLRLEEGLVAFYVDCITEH